GLRAITCLVTVAGPGVLLVMFTLPVTPQVPPGAAQAPPFPLKMTAAWLALRLTLLPKELRPQPPPPTDVPPRSTCDAESLLTVVAVTLLLQATNDKDS